MQSIHQLLLNELLQQHIYEKLSVHVVWTVQSIILTHLCSIWKKLKTLQYNWDRKKNDTFYLVDICMIAFLSFIMELFQARS